MPSLFVHLHVARGAATGRPDLLASSEYYLGSAAPDAVHTREGSGVAEHHLSHLMNDREHWEEDVISEWRRFPDADPFRTGYLVHILTDIRVDRYVTEYLIQKGLPHDWRDPDYQHMVRVLDRKMFVHVTDYPELAGFAASARPKTLPYGLSADDLERERQVMLREFDDLCGSLPYPDCAELPFRTYLAMTNRVASEIQQFLKLNPSS